MKQTFRIEDETMTFEAFVTLDADDFDTRQQIRGSNEVFLGADLTRTRKAELKWFLENLGFQLCRASYTDLGPVRAVENSDGFFGLDLVGGSKGILVTIAHNWEPEIELRVSEKSEEQIRNLLR